MQIQVKAFANSSVATVNFLVTEGWYSGRHVMAAPSEEMAVDASRMASPSTMANTLSSIDRAGHGGNNTYYRIAK